MAESFPTIENLAVYHLVADRPYTWGCVEVGLAVRLDHSPVDMSTFRLLLLLYLLEVATFRPGRCQSVCQPCLWLDGLLLLRGVGIFGQRDRLVPTLSVSELIS